MLFLLASWHRFLPSTRLMHCRQDAFRFYDTEVACMCKRKSISHISILNINDTSLRVMQNILLTKVWVLSFYEEKI